jgi:hypothetical protein
MPLRSESKCSDLTLPGKIECVHLALTIPLSLGRDHASAVVPGGAAWAEEGLRGKGVANR